MKVLYHMLIRRAISFSYGAVFLWFKENLFPLAGFMCPFPPLPELF